MIHYDILIMSVLLAKYKNYKTYVHVCIVLITVIIFWPSVNTFIYGLNKVYFITWSKSEFFLYDLKFNGEDQKKS